jgi:hypothetical protein
MPAAQGNFNGIGAVDTATNVNSNKPAATDPTAAAPVANPDNDDTYANTPMADAPPSARNSNSNTKHRH